MHKHHLHFHIGLRTVKTVAAVILSMVAASFFGATESRLIFAMLGAMSAVQPTFRESVESCLSQIVGVIFGAVAGILLTMLPVHPLIITGIGIVLVITLYNALRIGFSPILSCMIVVMLCYTEDLQPIPYAIGRIWDSTIGLGIGMLINTLIFPYDNSRKIRGTARSLDRAVLAFLEDMFDGDSMLPDVEKMNRTIQDMDYQLSIFSKQMLFLQLRRQRKELEAFKLCEGKARELVARMTVLSRMAEPGRLSAENRQALLECGASILDERQIDEPTEVDIVTNYHIRQILKLRQELLDALKK